jgi:thioredoxin 1
MQTKNKKVSFGDLIRSETPVLVDFHATWCGPCRMLAPVLEKIAHNNKDKMKVVKIDVDKNQAVAQSYRVNGVPTMILFKKGKPIWRQSGYMSVHQLQNELTPHI